MLDVQHLSVSYGITQVLRDVSFSVREGTVVALLGGNGSGKSTLLNALSGLITPRGRIGTVSGPGDGRPWCARNGAARHCSGTAGSRSVCRHVGWRQP